MEFKVLTADNMKTLRVKLDITYRALTTVRNLVDINVYEEKKDGREVPKFTVHDSRNVTIDTKGLAFPMKRTDDKIELMAQIDDEDETALKYRVALIKKGISEYLKNFENAQKEIEALTKDVEVD